MLWGWKRGLKEPCLTCCIIHFKALETYMRWMKPQFEDICDHFHNWRRLTAKCNGHTGSVGERTSSDLMLLYQQVLHELDPGTGQDADVGVAGRPGSVWPSPRPGPQNHRAAVGRGRAEARRSHPLSHPDWQGGRRLSRVCCVAGRE